MPDSYFYGLAATALTILVLHWFPWPSGKLHRLAAYTFGVASILAGQAVWLLPISPPQNWGAGGAEGAGGAALWLAIASFALVAGAATAIAWFADWVLNLRVRSVINDRRTDD